MKAAAEYIWIDGQKPTKKLRSKTKILDGPINGLSDIPMWAFDGSSTCQAGTANSDLILQPVFMVPDPTRGKPRTTTSCLRGGGNVLVLCEVLLPDFTPHESNTRAKLRIAAKRYSRHKPLFGIEQEYTLYDADGGRPFRWPKVSTAFPAPQGPYYCGIGSDEVYGRELIEAHTAACLKAGLAVAGTNAEVMPAQWEFQIGPLGPLEVADELWLARWLLYRLGENYGISAKLDPKPISGDWNGAGAHTNFSTRETRRSGGLKHIKEACERLGKFHLEHIKVYGADNDKRLTGRHETCDIKTFRYGIGDRGASIRIPAPVAKAGCGYFEDRRPAANVDPYEACRAILETVCGKGFKAED
ncbi:MAG: glutamine synthetase [Candidatus Harrisonbacteria bacterium RIFCSPHIGHO2_01_FULL_44_13]|uniref:Glutamine synthetase n=1 Tax=Candidatus Harrisonbacteria bacterium RIFCSPLOWO2_01_FULL_44_18 TaxID=1798407 RepID=A0A1G1ZLS5_9BACT|nr:MAG: glutamine synthetase [Candidatus Harrisonbacteria bacterium RIFCSPHIGHO2_01_FULL_44_13]OGY65389.1 MAG: glutamine synthetase [Candidatus Harrisonbacteria bacterium RIFCSPLOWO2_01_FULL_44_18]